MRVCFSMLLNGFLMTQLAFGQELILSIKPHRSKIFSVSKDKVKTLIDLEDLDKPALNMSNSRLGSTSTQKIVTQATVTKKDSNLVLLGYQQGYVTQGKLGKEFFEKGIGSKFEFQLEKQIGIPDTAKTKKIKFSHFVDAEGKISKSSSYFLLYEGIDLSQVSFQNLFPKFISDFGYDVIELDPLFIEKTDIPDFVLGGEIVWSSFDNKMGGGFKAATKVNWSVYESRTKKVIFKMSTYGYSDSKKVQKLGEELRFALKDALIGVLMDKEFKKLAIISSSKKSTESDANQPIAIEKTTPKKFEKYSDMVKSSTQSVLAIKSNIGVGSGFMISNDGFILTNFHVVDGAENIEVIFENGFSFGAEVVRNHDKRDVALLKISGKGFKPLSVNSSTETMSTGNEVIAIGTPLDLDLGQTVTKGIISGKREFEEQRFIQTDVSINPGNSGGPLLNENGEVIGIIVSRREDQNARGIGFAIPIKDALEKLKIELK